MLIGAGDLKRMNVDVKLSTMNFVDGLSQCIVAQLFIGAESEIELIDRMTLMKS